jgi:hypothetical protein
MKTISIIPTTGEGGPDYENLVAGSKERRGIHLDYGQTLKIFSLSWVSSPPIGFHTGAPSFTVMTNAGATFTPNDLIGLIIANISDGSYGIIIANTVNTVTVAALIGGITHQWNFGNFYSIGGAFPWVVPSLAPGGIQHIVDVDTGLPTPFTVPKDYTLTLIAAANATTEDGIAWVYLDGLRILCLGIAPGGITYFENKLNGVSTAQVDPTGASSHTLDVTFTNLGLGNLQGTIDCVLILEEVGSPPLPTVKTVRCQWCGQDQTVPNETTHIKCIKCSKPFIVYDLSKFRRTP